MEPNLFETPGRAIAAFEKLTQLRITVHEIEMPLGFFLPPERFRHNSPFCIAVKAQQDWACVDLEMHRVREGFAQFPNGRVHQCHAGFIEWVMPVTMENRLSWILFAGQAHAAGSISDLTLDVRKTKLPASVSLHRLRKVDDDESGAILESLRQLRARLILWRQEADAVFAHSFDHTQTTSTHRRLSIQSFLYRNHTHKISVALLARHLSLSESRTIHLVRELFDCTYVQLLNEMRLGTAASLLRNSSLTVLEVCANSGFEDLSHFHRLFLERFGSTPLRYRKGGRT